MKEYERSGLAGVPDYRAAEFAPRQSVSLSMTICPSTLWLTVPSAC